MVTLYVTNSVNYFTTPLCQSIKKFRNAVVNAVCVVLLANDILFPHVVVKSY